MLELKVWHTCLDSRVTGSITEGKDLVDTKSRANKKPQEAGIPRKLAPTIGISVDHRRSNHSQESLTANVDRLKSYKARLILFPRKSGQHKKLDSSESDVKAIQDGSAKTVSKIGSAFAVETGTGLAHGFSEIKSGEMPQGEEAPYKKLRELRAEKRYAGIREKRAKLKAEAEEAKKK